MAFWSGLLEGFNARRLAEDERNRKDALANRDTESKIAQRLLEDDDPRMQEVGLSILTEALQPAKKKRGLAGFLGNYQPSTALQPLLELARSQAGAPGQLAEVPPEANAAALPPGSPAEAERQGPSMLQRAVRGGGVTFGAPEPAAPVGGTAPPSFEGGAASAPEVPGTASFGGIQFGEPGMGTSAARTPAVNVPAIAARVSRDGGVSQPGERARLFYPSAARLASQKIKSEFQTKAQLLQALGATPQETLRAMMAQMGASGGQPNVTRAGYAKLADGTTVETFTLEQAGMPPQIVIAGPGGQMVPLPAGAQATRMPSGAQGSQTSRALGRDIIAQGIATEEDVDPGKYYSVKQVGDAITILPALPPSTPWDFQRGTGTPFAPGVGKGGEAVPLPQPTPNAQVSAAKALVTSLGGIPQMMRMTAPQRQRAFAQALQQYPALRGLTEGQVRALAGADEYLPADKARDLLQGVGGPALPPPPPPPGSPQAQGDPNTLPPGWAQSLVDELTRRQPGRPQ